jgi:hypothetical protein
MKEKQERIHTYSLLFEVAIHEACQGFSVCQPLILSRTSGFARCYESVPLDFDPTWVEFGFSVEAPSMMLVKGVFLVNTR